MKWAQMNMGCYFFERWLVSEIVPVKRYGFCNPLVIQFLLCFHCLDINTAKLTYHAGAKTRFLLSYLPAFRSLIYIYSTNIKNEKLSF